MSMRERMRLRFRLADPSLKIFTIKRKLHPLIGLDWFGEVTNVSIARWSYCCRVDEIDYDYGEREKREKGRNRDMKVKVKKVCVKI